MDGRPAAVLFDLDGTLVDSAPDLLACANVVADGFGVAPFDLATVTRFIGNGLPVLVERMLEARGLPRRHFGRAHMLFLDHYRAHTTDLTRPFNHIPAVLEDLRGVGVQLAVLTNKPQALAERVLIDLSLDRFFDAVVGSDSAAAKKPDPAAYFAACGKLKIAPAETIYVGDSETDAATAANAGVPFVLFLGGYRKQAPEAFETPYRFARFDDLPAVLDRLWSTQKTLRAS